MKGAVPAIYHTILLLSGHNISYFSGYPSIISVYRELAHCLAWEVLWSFILLPKRVCMDIGSLEL